jgi:hypothetical protein
MQNFGLAAGAMPQVDRPALKERMFANRKIGSPACGRRYPAITNTPLPPVC